MQNYHFRFLTKKVSENSTQVEWYKYIDDELGCKFGGLGSAHAFIIRVVLKYSAQQHIETNE